MTEKGLTVRILTNSLGSNDEIITNSAYKYKRIPVLETGAELYETRYDAKDRKLSEDPRVQAQWLGLRAKKGQVLIFDKGLHPIADAKSLGIYQMSRPDPFLHTVFCLFIKTDRAQPPARRGINAYASESVSIILVILGNLVQLSHFFIN